MQVATINGVSGKAILTKAGKVVGSRFNFAEQGMSIADVRAGLKAEGLKGRELTRKVNEVVYGGKEYRNAKFMASLSVMMANGLVADTMDVRKTSAVVRFVKPKSPTDGVTQDEAMEVLAKGKGMSLDELKALLGL